MKLSQLQYAIQKEYTIPYLPYLFYGGLFCSLSILIPVNVALVGSDVVTTLKYDPTVVDKPWWMPRSWPSILRPYIPDRCQPASITDDMNLRTNSSMPIFKYVLQSAYSSRTRHHDPTNRIYPVPYLANTLSDCEIRTMTWRVEIPATNMRYQARIHCSLLGSKPSNFEDPWPDQVVFIMTHSRADNLDLSPDDMVAHLTSTVSPESRKAFEHTYGILPTLGNLSTDSSSSNNVLAVLDAMHSDLSGAIWTQYHIWNAMDNSDWLPTYIVEWTARTGQYCRSGNGRVANATCGSMIDGGRWLRQYGTDEDTGRNASFIMPFNITIINAFIALRDAIMIDLGNLKTSSNIYLNKMYFNEVIRVDSFHAEGGDTLINHAGDARVNSSNYWSFCSYWSCANTSLAEAYRNKVENQPFDNIVLPYRPNDTQVPSVLRFRYLCPTFQRKSTSALLVSVFTSTATIIGSLYTIFGLYMPKVEGYYQRRKQAFAQAINRNIEDQTEEEQALVGKPLARRDTFGSANTLYDPVPQAEKDEETPTKDVTINRRLQKLLD
ncbi:hypothetical protein B0J17DRAFT_649292 [Rhizoctonia solani]|nr:hypothetical protein B0J17DRAFT_649292 [Rhizoctonia solani]